MIYLYNLNMNNIIENINVIISRLAPEVVELKKQYIKNKMEQNFLVNTLTTEQHEALSFLCKVRHKFHINMYSIIKGHGNNYLNALIRANDILFKSGLPKISDIPDNILDNYEFIHRYRIDKNQINNTLEFNRLYKQLNDLNDHIELYIDEIDKKYGTQYKPSGAARTNFYMRNNKRNNIVLNNIILNNINALLAKLTEKQYAPYKELYESMKEEYDKRYDHIFGIGNNRLYLNDNVEIKAVDYSVDLFSVDFAKFITFLTNNLTEYYFENLYLDILYNRIYSKDGREYKLTKFLQLLTEQKLKNVTKEEYDYILNAYDVKEIISYYISSLPPKSILNDDGKIKLIVVISRNPYDIAGMSTDRRWTSCMRLPDDDPSIYPGGAYHQHLINDIELGTLVAYLIEPTDKNIEHPYARIAIKPYQNIKDKSIVLYAENRVYNDASLDDNIYEEFKNIVNNFLDKIQDDKEGIFESMPDLYNDSKENFKIKTNENKKSILIRNIIDFNKILNIDNNTGIDIIKKAIVTSRSKNNTEYIENFNSLANIYNLIIDHLDIENPNIITKIAIESLTADNYQNKTVINESGKIISILNLPDIIHYKSLSNNKYIDEKYLNLLLNRMKDKIKWIEDHEFDIKNINSYDFYIVDNSKNKNYDSIYGDLYRIDNRWRIPNYGDITFTNQYNSNKIEKMYSIYVVKSGDKINKFIYKLDLDAFVNLTNIITFYKVYSKKDTISTYNFNYDITFNVKAFIIKNYDYKGPVDFLYNTEIAIETLLTARLSRPLSIDDIVNL